MRYNTQLVTKPAGDQNHRAHRYKSLHTETRIEKNYNQLDCRHENTKYGISFFQ